MKFGILTQYFPPEIGAPQNRLSELAVGLSKRGHEVHVLTAMPSYPQGKIYTGYGGLFRKERWGEIHVFRTFITPTQKTKLIPRLIHYFSFVFSSILIGGWMLPDLDYLMCESPPLFLGISGYIISRWKKARWLFNVSDLWPESAVRLGMVQDGWGLRLSYNLEAFCYRKAWAVIGQSQGILTDIQNRYPGVQTYLFSNGVSTKSYLPEAASRQDHKQIGVNGEVFAVYAGLHGLAQGLDQILSAAQKLEECKHLKFVFIGDGPEKKHLVQRAADLGLKNVRFLDPVPKGDMASILASADIWLAPLRTQLPGAVPSKIYEGMAAGIPVVVIADGEAAQIVCSNAAGVAVTPGNVEAIAASLHELADNPDLRAKMGESGRRAAQSKYDRDVIIEGFADYLVGATGKREPISP